VVQINPPAPCFPCGSSVARTPECESGDARSIRAPGTTRTVCHEAANNCLVRERRRSAAARPLSGGLEAVVESIEGPGRHGPTSVALANRFSILVELHLPFGHLFRSLLGIGDADVDRGGRDQAGDQSHDETHELLLPWASMPFAKPSEPKGIPHNSTTSI